MEPLILVTGGTGALGTALVPILVAAGRRVRVLTHSSDPRPQTGVEYVVGDLESGLGIDAAVRGIPTVIHAAGSAKADAAKTRCLVDALQRSGLATHLVFISVVGADTTPVTSAIDRATLGYFDEKRRAELIVEASGVPWTILRATQFHSFFVTFAQLALKLPFAVSFRGFRYQPVDERDVAARLVELALADPAGLVPDIGGPRIYPMEELMKTYLRAAGRERPVLRMPVPGGAAKAQRAGANLTRARATGTRTWEQRLAELFPVRAPL